MNRKTIRTLLWLATMFLLPGERGATQHSNLPFCTAPNEQLFPDIVSDGYQGAIITWMDARNGNRDVFTQRINAKGKVLWKENGIPICRLK